MAALRLPALLRGAPRARPHLPHPPASPCSEPMRAALPSVPRAPRGFGTALRARAFSSLHPPPADPPSTQPPPKQDKDEFFEQITALRERAAELPDELFVCLVRTGRKARNRGRGDVCVWVGTVRAPRALLSKPAAPLPSFFSLFAAPAG